MASASEDFSVGQGRPGLSPSLVLPLCTATLFLSAFLLFSVQAMFTKMVLPSLGGAAAEPDGAFGVVVLARTEEYLNILNGGQPWRILEAYLTSATWTDDFSNIVGALRWRPF
jgi:hypothetical protein